jgi:hypothetical protein
VGPTAGYMNSKIFQTISNSNQTRSNLIHTKHDPPKLKKIEIKYGCEGFNVWNNLSYRNLLRFEIDFELKIREASRI